MPADWRSRCAANPPALWLAGFAQDGDGFVDVALAGLRSLGLTDRQNQGLPTAMRQRGEYALGVGLAIERGAEIRWEGQLARFGVELDVDIYLITTSDV